VLAIRATDRIGKGIRSSPRDAIIADATPADRRGSAFGYHRAMDNAGALLGPLAAFALLELAGLGARPVFALAAIPGFVALVVLLVVVKEPPAPARAPAPEAHDGRLPPRFYAYLACLALFTLGNSTDFFLLLRAQDAGISVAETPLLWAVLNAVKALFARPLSGLSDRIGRKRVILAGWAVYAAAYLGFAHAQTARAIWLLFAFYGFFYALTEGTEKALVADLAPASLRGRAFGYYNFTVGAFALPASVGFGWIWDRVGHGAAFAVGAGLAGAAALGLLFVPTRS
jgi:MFS family permease